MAVRTVRVGPDQIFTTRFGQEIPVVSHERQVWAAARMATVVDICGGAYSVLYGRQHTGIEGEFVTTELLLHWRDRGDAKAQHEEAVSFEDVNGVSIFGEGEEPVEVDPDVDIEYVEPDAHIDGNGVVHHAEDAVSA